LTDNLVYLTLPNSHERYTGPENRTEVKKTKTERVAIS
jgi:hypothetical protein